MEQATAVANPEKPEFGTTKCKFSVWSIPYVYRKISQKERQKFSNHMNSCKECFEAVNYQYYLLYWSERKPIPEILEKAKAEREARDRYICLLNS